MSESRFRYRRSDFGPLSMRLDHMDIRLDFGNDGVVRGTNRLAITALEPLERVALNARDLRIGAVRFAPARQPPAPAPFRYDGTLLTVCPSAPLAAGASFVIEVEAACVPSETLLEGIYRDTTPPGCPQQYVSQCQQWGFQRILPVIDDCTAKCTMRTTIEADARYTHLVSNGDICRDANPDLRPAPVPGRPGRQTITYRNRMPMAPYLFVVCVGTWDMLADEVVYPSGRRVRLEYLVPPGRRDGARVPMEILKESILWQGRTQGYEYPYDVYRTICMEKSNFGGMENVGNTTIITEAALIDEYTGDRRLAYAHGVIVHEFEHNQCGSDVTMQTPFDMWLNEAHTVDVERQFLAGMFDPEVQRLHEVDQMRAPITGPLDIEDGGRMGNIVREGFNDPDELVDGVTYVKAAEVIRMLRLLLGEEGFNRARDLYFSRYRGGNANTDDFFGCFEAASGRDLSQFRREWLHTIGYPRVEATHVHDPAARVLRVSLVQTRQGGGGPFHVPVAMAAVGADGRDLPGTNRVVELREANRDFVFDNVDCPAFLSLNRDCSFYGSFADRSATREQLALQTRLDGSGLNRVEAMRRLTDMERIRLIEDPAAAVGSEWLDLYGAIAADESLRPGLKAFLLTVDEQSLDRRYLPFYRERWRARRELLAAAGRRHSGALAAAFRGAGDPGRVPAGPRDGIDERRLRGVLLRTLVAAELPAAHALAEDLFRRARHITDRVNALTCIQVSEHPRRRDLVEEAYGLWSPHLSAYAQYLGVIGQGTQDDVFEMIEREERRPTFREGHPTYARALYLPVVANNRALWSARGIDWVARTVVRLAPLNEITAVRMVGCFQQVNNLASDLREPVRAALRAMRAAVDPQRTPSVAGHLDAMLR